jgi:hypothetical protein
MRRPLLRDLLLPTRLLGCLLLLALLAGCGKNDGNHNAIQGDVKLDGKPLEQGSILFTPTEGTKGVVTGGEINNGHYQLAGKNGAAAGWNRIEIRAVRKTGKMVQKPLAPQGEMVEEYGEAVAPKFNSSSTLKVEVKPGENKADFEVTSK